MNEPFSLQRDFTGRQPYRRIIGPDGKQLGPTFGDTSGPREAEPWLRALNAAYKLGVEIGTFGCECDNTHEANDTVCRWCWAHGRRKWADPEITPTSEQRASHP